MKNNILYGLILLALTNSFFKSGIAQNRILNGFNIERDTLTRFIEGTDSAKYVRYEGMYQNGIKLGLWNKFDDQTGHLLGSFFYNQFGVEVERKSYYRNGLVKWSHFFVSSVDSVEIIEDFFPNGFASTYGVFNTDENFGFGASFSRSGQIDKINFYSQSFKHYKWEFDIYGTLIYMSIYDLKKKSLDYEYIKPD